MSDNIEKNAESPAGFETQVQSPEGVKERICRWTLRGRMAPAGIWSRIGLLFTALCLIQLMILVTFRKHLFGVYWRAGDAEWTQAGKAAFWVFALLVGLNLWALGTRCMAAGTRVVRTVNAFVLVLGAMFILLTFHEGNKNYLYPVISGTLGWKDIGWYLSLNFFFRSPYLAAWLLGYALAYYGLARSGHERLILRVTAACAAAYTALYLGDLAQFRDALIVADCMGIVCLAAGRGSGRPLSVLLLCLLLICAGSLFVLFHRFDNALIHPVPEFVLLAGDSIVLFVGITALAWRCGFYAAWSWFLPFAFTAFLFLVNSNYPLSHLYQNMLCLGLMLPRYFLGALCETGVVLVVAFCYHRWRPAASRLWLDMVNLVLIALGLVDLRLCQIMGVRLDWQVLAFGASPKMMWRMAQPYVPSAMVFLIGVAALYGVALWILERCRRRQSEGPDLRGGPNGLFFALAFVLLGLAGCWLTDSDSDKVRGQAIFRLMATSPWWKRAANSQPLEADTFTKTARQFGMWQMQLPAPKAAQPPRNLNVVLVFQESVYNKYISLFGGEEETEPFLSQYKYRMEIFPDFFSDFAASMQARFAAFAGLYPVRDYTLFTLKRVGVKSIFEILRENDYDCSVFYSSFFDYTGFGDFLNGRGIDKMYDADTMPGQRKTTPVSWGLREEETLGAIQEQIRKYAASKQKFFLTYVPAAPHYPYDNIPKRFCKYQTGKIGDYRSRYLNELLYMDWVIASIVDELKTADLLDSTLVVITSDHGEMLGDKDGVIGHGWVVTPELANVPLIIMDPEKQGYRVNNAVGSQVDLLPTLLEVLKIPSPPDQLFQGSSLYSGGDETNRQIYLNSFAQYAVIHGRQLICAERESKGKGAAGKPGNTFTIMDTGSHPSFAETQSGGEIQFDISAFDSFQENFLQNYSYYCKIMRPVRAVDK
jgi:hypothetical protein